MRAHLQPGVGLLPRRCWAEYFTILTTRGLIPLEIFELGRNFKVTPAKKNSLSLTRSLVRVVAFAIQKAAVSSCRVLYPRVSQPRPDAAAKTCRPRRWCASSYRGCGGPPWLRCSAGGPPCSLWIKRRGDL